MLDSHLSEGVNYFFITSQLAVVQTARLTCLYTYTRLICLYVKIQHACCIMFLFI